MFNMKSKIQNLKSKIATVPVVLLLSVIAFSGGCMVGPNYRRPSAPVPPAYEESPPQSWRGTTWTQAHPNDGALRGDWWKVYNDPDLDALEAQVNISNQNVLMAAAQFEEARAAVRVARSALFPVISTNPSYSNSRTSSTLFNFRAGNLTSGTRNIYDFPFDVSYTADLWGSIRRTVRGSEETAQASFGQLQNAHLTYQSDLAEDYYELRGTDGDIALLQKTVNVYESYLTLTQERFRVGVASGADVALAQTQLDTAQAQLMDYGVARAQFEHAIAILIGKPPAEVSVPIRAITITPPQVPVGLPSELLERRPDIAFAERDMAAANEQIGIAQAAFYPTLTLSATGGLETGSLTEWFNLPSGFWSFGPQLAETLVDFGRRRGVKAEAQAAYNAAVANYRQTVLTAFQQVEDNLAALRVLENEAQAEDRAVKAAQNSLTIETNQYKAGVVDYLNVIAAQTTLFTDETATLNILTRRMTASVLLIEYLGGGWNSSALPTPQSLGRHH